MNDPFAKRKPNFFRRMRKPLMAGGAFLLALLIALLVYFIPPKSLLKPVALRARGEGELRVHFLSLGQGDCTAVQFPDGEVLLIDAGDGSFEHENELFRFLKALKPASLSFALTHADIDHYGGFTELFSVYQVKRVYLPVLAAENADYLRFFNAAEKSGAEKMTLARYTAITNPTGAYLVCISPYSQGETDDNASSAVFYLSYCGVNVLLGADITAERESLLLREYALSEDIFDSGECRVRLDEVDVLRVSHHGSAYSSSEAWLRLIGAEHAVISCGRGNRYSHPFSETVERLEHTGSKVYRLDELGHLTLSITSEDYTIYGSEL